MQRLFNDEWSFAKLPLGSTLEQARSAAFTPVDLPHDFLIRQADDLYESTDAWYRRVLRVPDNFSEHVWLLRFDGVYMDCDVLVNGQIVCTHRYGYTAFDAMLTDALTPGDNEVMVHIRHQSPNSRWYSGAGIFRDVTLHVLPQHYMPLDGVYAHTRRHEGDLWELSIHAELAGEPDDYMIEYRLLDTEGEVIFEHAQMPEGDVCGMSVGIEEPMLWDCDEPNYYILEVQKGEQIIRQHVGFRSFEMTTDSGLFLNGKPIKLHGVCLHHDLGALGSAFREKAARRQLMKMREMGVNALRTSHNPPARQMLDLCDELGIIVVDECYDMWERPKTPYDNARFFNDTVEEDVASWVRRDRNHPCVCMWSIGNEIFDTHVSERGVEITKLLKSLVERNDPLGNALPTIGSNYMPWEGAQNCADVLKIAGYNYGEKYYEPHHAAHPDWVIYGSETASLLSSRGIYHFPKSASVLSDVDLQCSALGNSTSSWGCRDLRSCIVDDLNNPYSMGQFIWSGIDYIGEPTPYHTRSCYFGHMDTACFPKDTWYLFKSLWTDEPMIHIGVYWDWNPGQLIDVQVMTSGASCELLLNGRSLGVQNIDRRDPEKCMGLWQVPYEAGELCARAYDTDGNVIAEEYARSFGESASIALKAEERELKADGNDMAFVEISMVDAAGRPVENALDRVNVRVTGAGYLLGLDNGDSTDAEGYKTTTRHLFSGKLLAMIGTTDEVGEVCIEVTSPGKEPAMLTIPVVAAEVTEGRSFSQRIAEQAVLSDCPVRRIDLKAQSATVLTPDHPEVAFKVICLPAGALAQEITYSIVNSAGIESPCAKVEQTADGVIVHAAGDGEIYLRAMCNNGDDHPRIISQKEIIIQGMGMPYLDPYGFIAGGLYDVSEGEIAAGNEQGLSFARDGYSMAGFSNIDFGPVGSDEITLPIFALSGDLYEITVYLGDPRNGGQKIAVLPYEKPSQWNVYQSETYRLPVRLTGIQTLCFSMTEKVHMKGFSFTRQSRAWVPQSALQADAVYGDSFTKTDEGVVGIGNNVSIVYEGMDFGEGGAAKLTIDGATPLAVNPVTIRIVNADGEQDTLLCQFEHSDRTEQTFDVKLLPGVCSVAFVFLPGCQFDFYGFRFAR